MLLLPSLFSESIGINTIFKTYKDWNEARSVLYVNKIVIIIFYLVLNFQFYRFSRNCSEFIARYLTLNCCVRTQSRLSPLLILVITSQTIKISWQSCQRYKDNSTEYLRKLRQDQKLDRQRCWYFKIFWNVTLKIIL